MYEINTIQNEINELRNHVADWHVEAWRHRVNGNKPEMKALHKKIKTCKGRIRDREWMLATLMQCHELRQANATRMQCHDLKARSAGYTLFNVLSLCALLRFVEFLCNWPCWPCIL